MARLSKEQKEEIRKKILEQSNLLFIELGYDKTSTSKIAKKVGIAEGTIFNYFDSKADIFLEVMTMGFVPADISTVIDTKNRVYDIIYDFLYTSFKTFAVMPKRMMRDLSLAMVTIAKKKPSLIKSLADLDYKLLEDLRILLAKMLDKGLIKDCDVDLAADTIYSSLMFELLIYVYENDRPKDTFLNNVRTKIEFVMKSYVVD